MKSSLKSRLWLLVKLSFAFGIIAYLVISGRLDLKAVWGLMTFQNVVIALALTGLNIVLAAWRWILLLKGRGFELPFWRGFSLYMIGLFFNYALPGSVSGDLVRGYYLVQDYPTRKVDGVLSVLIDRVLGLYSLFIMTLVAVLWDLKFALEHEQIRWVTTLCFFIFLGMTGFFAVCFSPRLYRWLGASFVFQKIEPVHRMMVAVQSFGQNRRILMYSVLLSIAAQACTMAMFYQLGYALGLDDVTWKAILFAVPMGFVVSAVPISPAGVGVGQVAFMYLFQTYFQKPSQFGAVAITAFQLALAVWAILGAVIFIRRRQPHDLDQLTPVPLGANG